MSLLQCSHCGKDISATHKDCPHCGVKISFWGEVKCAIERSRLRQVGLALLVLFVLGTSWFIGKNTGYRWPLYMFFILCAPVVPWLLQLAYKSAAPIVEEEKASDVAEHEQSESHMIEEYDENGEIDPAKKIWRG